MGLMCNMLGTPTLSYHLINQPTWVASTCLRGLHFSYLPYGCNVDLHFLGTSGYADVLYHLSPTLTGVKNMVEIFTSYAEEYHNLLNGVKNHLIWFCQKKPCNFCLRTADELHSCGPLLHCLVWYGWLVADSIYMFFKTNCDIEPACPSSQLS